MTSPEILSVSQLSSLLKNVLEAEFPTVWVAGEISNLSRPQSGHVYFTLKDDQAQIRGVIWRSTVQRTRFEIEEGMQIVCCGNIDLYPPRGSYQLVVRSAEPLGMGPLQLAFQQLHQKLTLEGLFESRHKKPIPPYPVRIGVVTSPTGAAIRDFLQILRRRWNHAEVIVLPSRVQGEGAAREIVQGVRAANRIRPGLDVLVVTRGGGSLEDLWSFNEEPVVRAIFDSEIPVISAVGHEIDVTLSDLVADLRALTPSEAAEKVVPSRDEMRRRIFQLKNTLDHRLLGRLESAYQRLIQIESRPIFRRPLDRIRDDQRRLDELEAAADRGLERNVAQCREKILSLGRQLEAVSPLAVLQRGYSVTQKAADQQVVATVASIKKGDLVQTQVADGKFISRIEEIDPMRSQ
ncbi:MAG: exodeoxyribonuclease VII large subunit [Planctomycetota bacterium]|nr:exodeoxyribonuclease VII large subunit [Planctomycetota bacterium]